MYAWLPDALANEGVVVTANRRLARVLRAAVVRAAVEAGRTAWPTPLISDWQSWLADMFESAFEPLAQPVRIDGFSARLIWEREFLACMPADVLNAAGIAREAYRAWQLANDWQLSVGTLRETARRPDEDCFARTAAAYAKHLANRGFIDNAQLPAAVTALVESDGAPLPRKMTFAGFNRPTPAFDRLIRALDDHGVEVAHAKPRLCEPNRLLAEFDEETSELRAAGAWARDILTDNPAAAIAIVRPGLESEADRVVRAVREGFCPGWQYADASHRDAVNVSYGRPLVDYPAIRVAKLVLQWSGAGVGSRELGLLLRTPLLALVSPADGSRLDLRLRSMPDQQWSPALVRTRLDPDGDPAAAHGLAAVCARLEKLSDERPSVAKPSAWAAHFDNVLNTVGWPGEGTLSSEEFQLVNRWRELLNAFAGTSNVEGNMSFGTSLTHVVSRATETLYQPKSEHGLVQVMGVLETAGVEFDHVWMSGLDSSRWPPRASPNPFIARSLQQSAGMPDSTPSDTVDYARQLQTHLETSSIECVFSWARQNGDAELTVSTLLDLQATSTYAGPGDPGWHAAALSGRSEMAIVDGDEATPVASGETVSGGAYCVQAQASEPFAGFVKGRLHVNSVESFVKGLSSKRRGILVHEALHNLFHDKPGRAQVAAWGPDETSRQIGSAVDRALAPIGYEADSVTLAVIRLERERLRGLLHAFLECEIERGDFQVAAVEERLSYEAEGVSLLVQVDRIDRLPDGSCLIFDYKTGNAGNFLDRGGELREVQLVVYADALDENVGGLANVVLDPRRIEYKGSGPGLSGADADDWPESLAGWIAEVRGVLRQLAAGDIRINTGRSGRERRAYAILSRVEELRRV